MGTLLTTIIVIGVLSVISNNFDVMPLGTYCFISSTLIEGQVSLMVISILNWISVITVLISYISILLVAIKTKFATKLSIQAQLKSNSELNIAIMRVLLILGFYLLTNSYETYLELWSIITKMDRSQESDFIATVLQNFNPLVNCILLLLINNDVSTSLVTWVKDIKI
jgi:uncharacterized protein YsxB (DUF464 family)